MCSAPVLPRYGQSSLSEVLPAMLAALGEPAPEPPAIELPPVRAAAILLIDGLGSALLADHAQEAPFLSTLTDAGPLTAGFPSSTSVSLSSLGTGLPPGAHGMVGISFRTPNGELLDTLQWKTHGVPEQCAVDLRDHVPPERIQAAPTAMQRAAAAGIATTVVSQRAFRDSGLTRAALRGGRYRGTHAMGDLAAEVVTAMTGDGRQLCYGYHADLDSLGHAYGPGSLPWRLQLAEVDRLAMLVAERLPSDALLLITGDHGMVEVDHVHDADTDPELMAGVALLGGDPRSRLVYAQAGAEADVLAAWQAKLGDDAWVVPAEQAVAEGWFGPVAAELRERIGDVVVAARGSAAVIRSVAEARISKFPGQHGSLSAEEQLVPLLITHTA